MLLCHKIQVEQTQKYKLWGKHPMTSVHASISKPRSCAFNIDGTLKASILLLPPVPTYVIIRYARINTVNLKLPLCLNCELVINNFDSLSVDFRFWYW